MRLIAHLLVLLTLCSSLVGLARRASAAPVRIIASDARGVTLQVDVGAFAVSAPDRDGASRLQAPGLEEMAITGRPALPAAGALLAIPPGARAVARVIGEDGERLDENVRLTTGPEAGFRGDGGPLGTVPYLESVPAIGDGPWPRDPIEVGEPFTIRRQTVVMVRIWPFRYDAEAHRLWSRQSMTVRVDFVGGDLSARALGSAPDGPFEPLLRTNLLNYEQGRSWRTPGGRATLEASRRTRAEGIGGETEPEVRVLLDTTGVYSIEYDELANHAYPASVPISEVSVHRHEYIQDAPAPGPAHATIEMPIEVLDNDGDGSFGPGDRILVYVQNWAERSRASFGQRVWGDGEVVYVTRTPGRPALRVATRPGWLDRNLTPLGSYPFLHRYEKNNFYVPVFQPGLTDTGNTDQFVWVPAGPAGTSVQLYFEPDSFAFEVNDVDTTKRVAFTVTWRGTRSLEGKLTWAHIRNATRNITSIVDSASWTGRSLFSRTTTVFGSAFSEGNRNVLRAWGRTNPCAGVDCERVFAVIDWFQATYWRRFNALNGYLTCNNAGTSGDYQIDARGFGYPPGLRVYDVTDSIRPTRLLLADSLISPTYPHTVRFQDNAPGGAFRRYVVFDNPRRLAPERYTTVLREDLAGHSAADYLIIVPEAFREAVEPLRALRESQNLSVIVAPLEAVNDEFNGGRKSSYAIRRFIRYAYRNWDSQYVLLVGDASEDPQQLLAPGDPTFPKDWVPAQKIAGPVPISDNILSVNESIPSDPWYVWCVDCPSIISQRKIHDLFIGRLPVNSLTQAQAVIDKIVKYENPQGDQEWRKRLLLLADDAYSTVSFFGGGNPGDAFYCHRSYEEVFLGISQAIRDSVHLSAGLGQMDAYVFDLGDSLIHETPLPPPNETCRASWPGTQQSTRLSVSPKLFQRLSAGVLWWNFQGHANPSVLTHEDLYVNRGPDDDKSRITNVDKPFLFSAFSCHPNFFTRVEEGSFGPSLGEDLVNLPASGAVASWGSSGYEIIPFSDSTHVNNHLARALFWHTGRDTIHDVPWNGQVRIGEAVAQALLDNLFRTCVFPGGRNDCSSFLEREVGISYQLLGDPATRFSIGASQFTVTANGQPVIDGEPVRLQSGADTLRIVADIASNTRIARITIERTDANGTALIDSTAFTVVPYPDSLNSAGRRWRLSYFTTLGEGGYRYTIRTVDVNGTAAKFEIVFRFFVVLRADGITVSPGDPVRPDAVLELLVISPRPITSPQDEFVLRINGQVVSFTATHAAGDLSGREWVLTWDHAPYATGQYRIELDVPGGLVLTSGFSVATRTAIQNAFAFPNPFDEELGTHFSFTLEGDGPANLLLRVYTVSGKLIYDRTLTGVLPGYHQIAWNGEDAESDKLANGIYLYRLIARTESGQAVHEGRLVKLRKPIRRAPVEGE
jgi:hypothetical protein